MSQVFAHDLFRFVNFVMKLFNLDNKQDEKWRQWFLVYILVSTTIWAVSSMLSVFMQHEYSDFVSAVTNYAIVNGIWIKVICFYYRRNEVNIILQEIYESFWPISSNAHELPLYRYHQRLRKFILTYQAGLGVCVVFIFITKMHITLLCNVKFFGVRKLTELPSPYLQIVNTLMYFTVGGGVILVLAFESWFVLMIGSVVLQLRILNQKFRNVHKDRPSEVCRKLRTYVAHHNRILQLVANTQVIISEPMIEHYVNSIGCIALYSYVLQQNILFQYASPLVITIFRTYLFSILGQQLQDEGYRVAVAVYESAWEDSIDGSFARVVLRVMQRSQKPLILSAGYMIDMSVESFVMIMKTASSFLALLGTVKSKDSPILSEAA